MGDDPAAQHAIIDIDADLERLKQQSLIAVNAKIGWRILPSSWG